MLFMIIEIVPLVSEGKFLKIRNTIPIKSLIEANDTKLRPTRKKNIRALLDPKYYTIHSGIRKVNNYHNTFVVHSPKSMLRYQVLCSLKP